jgi:hypothetical protein
MEIYYFNSWIISHFFLFFSSRCGGLLKKARPPASRAGRACQRDRHLRLPKVVIGGGAVLRSLVAAVGSRRRGRPPPKGHIPGRRVCIQQTRPLGVCLWQTPGGPTPAADLSEISLGPGPCGISRDPPPGG